jgi:ankyrin repeat protein
MTNLSSFLITPAGNGTLGTGAASFHSSASTAAEPYTERENEPGRLSGDLVEAIKNGDREAVKALLENGHRVLACDCTGDSALHHAVRAKTGSRKVLKELLKSREMIRNPNGINRPNMDGETPLHLAIRLGKAELVTKLLAAGADVDGPDRYGRPPLERALSGNKDKIVEILLESNANERLLRHENCIDRTIARRLSQVRQIMNSRKESKEPA